MPYVPVPKDLTKVKSKIAFNLTKRQLVCFGSAAAVGVPIYLLTRHALGNDIAVLLMIVLMLPFFFLAMFEKDGQPFEKVAYQYIRARFLCPRVRPYKTDNLYAALERQNRLNREAGLFDADQAKKAKGAGTAARRRKPGR